MAGKCILFADADQQALQEFRGIMGPEWHVTNVTDGNAALVEMESRPADVIVACIDLPGLDGAELLNRIRVAHPETVRFIGASRDTKQRVIGHMVGGHQFLAKPFDGKSLKTTIERSVSTNHLIVNATMRELISSIRTLPTIPSLYLEVISALNNPNATTEEVGAIVAKDMAMTTKMLQVLNSAYFSLPQPITDPAEAVGLLGFESVKSLIMSVKLMSQYDKVKPVYFSIDSIWKHSTNVAWIAKQFAILEVGDPVLAASAYTAGLTHDLGKVILAANFDQQYSGAHALARKQQLPLWEVEREIFGATHGELGAYLFGLWGMPADIIEAAAFHHQPSRAPTKTFSPLTAVHAANALEYEGNPGSSGLVAATFDLDYLRGLGLGDRLDTWRDAVSSISTPAPQPQRRSQPVSTKVSSTEPASPVMAATTDSQEQAVGSARSWSWIKVLYGALGVAAVVGLIGWLSYIQPESAETQTKAPITTPVAVAVPSPPKPAVVPAPVAKAAPLPVVAPTPVRVVLPSAADMAFNDLKLQGIFFSAHRPAAIVNGRLTHVNESVAGCRVVAISSTSVTFEFQSHRRTISLK
jgi:HD-like signal output (HDOD) protein